MATAEDLRKYVSRDWSLVSRMKRDFWVERQRRIAPVEALRIADELRRQVRITRPDWPTPADRAADLAAHIRLEELLIRAAPTRER